MNTTATLPELHSPSTGDALGSTFAADGFIILRDAIPLDLIARVREVFDRRCDDIMRELAGEGLIADPCLAVPLERRLIGAEQHLKRYGRSWRKPLASSAVFDLHRSPVLVAALRTLLGPTVFGHSIFNARPKLPGQELTVVPWHQDSAYFGPNTYTSTIITTWIPLVPVDTDNGCMQMARGSHRFGMLEHRTQPGEGGYLEIPATTIDPTVIETCVMRPGDALLFNNQCWHRSVANVSDGIRWSIDLRFHGADAEPGVACRREFPQPFIISDPVRPATSEREWLAQCAALPWW